MLYAMQIELTICIELLYIRDKSDYSEVHYARVILQRLKYLIIR